MPSYLAMILTLDDVFFLVLSYRLPMQDDIHVQWLLQKYGETIKEEVNVKEISLIQGDQWVVIQYIPLWKTLWSQFGKDTWRIIWSAKQWNASLQTDGTLLVTSWESSWSLTPEQFEVRYSWFDAENQIVEDGVMIELDLKLTEDLLQEGVAREMSRFLNQMRKDAGYDVSDRISCWYTSGDSRLIKILEVNSDYLQQEALLRQLWLWEITHDYSAEFFIQEKTVTFYMKK